MIDVLQSLKPVLGDLDGVETDKLSYSVVVPFFCVKREIFHGNLCPPSGYRREGDDLLAEPVIYSDPEKGGLAALTGCQAVVDASQSVSASTLFFLKKSSRLLSDITVKAPLPDTSFLPATAFSIPLSVI